MDRAQREARKIKAGGYRTLVFRFGGITLLWLITYGLTLQMGEEGQIKRFDPFQILEIEPGAENTAIKKAYRQLSIIYHPDKNPDDPLAATRWMEIRKAYNALTDEAARKNYEKYGNPDGPQTTKVGIGLPRFLLQKDNQLITLCAFFFLLIVMAPATFISYWMRNKNYASNGVMLGTMQVLGYFINDTTRLKSCPELLAASVESRSMEMRPSDNEAMKPVSQAVLEHKKRQFDVPIVVKNQFLLWAHMQRQHHLMSQELREDCDQLLMYSMKISQGMIEIACIWEWLETALTMIEFRRSLVQALDVKGSQLLQIPHFDAETVKQIHKGKHAVHTLSDFLAKAPEERKGLVSLQPQEVADVEAFAQHVSDLQVKAKIEVEGEDCMVTNDVATVTVRLDRLNLQENEAMGPVHAPLFPETKFEEWWLFLVEGGSPRDGITRVITSRRIRDAEKVVVEKLQFQLYQRPGEHRMVLHVVCDSYAGIDQQIDLDFTVMSEDQASRKVFIHPDDEQLDLHPTLFQQLMGDFTQEEESEDEEEEEGDKNKSKKAATTKADLSKGASKAVKGSDDDTEDTEENKSKGGSAGNKKTTDDSSDSSSSDSD